MVPPWAAVLTACLLLFEKWSTHWVGGHLQGQFILVVPDVRPRIWNKHIHAKKKKPTNYTQKETEVKLRAGQSQLAFYLEPHLYGLTHAFMDLCAYIPPARFQYLFK